MRRQTVSDLARDPRHQRVHRRDVDRRVLVEGFRPRLKSRPANRVELAVVAAITFAKGLEASAYRGHVVAHSGRRVVGRDTEAGLERGTHLAPQAEHEAPTRPEREVPGGGRGDRGGAREGHRDIGTDGHATRAARHRRAQQVGIAPDVEDPDGIAARSLGSLAQRSRQGWRRGARESNPDAALFSQRRSPLGGPRRPSRSLRRTVLAGGCGAW
jgi:hypothetical protein